MARPRSRPRRLAPINHPWCDDRDSPLHRIRYPAAPSVEDIAGFFAAFTPWADRVASPWAVVFDLSGLEQSSSETREAFAVGGRRVVDCLRNYCVAYAVVTPSTMLRGIATAVMWIERPSWPVQMFATEAEAEAWARAQLDGATPNTL